MLTGQAAPSERPVPILTGNAGFFTNVNAGQVSLVPEINPVLLVPLGQRWLVESRAEFEGEFARPQGGGPYGGQVDKEIDYLQLDFVANPYVTVTAGSLCGSTFTLTLNVTDANGCMSTCMKTGLAVPAANSK